MQRTLPRLPATIVICSLWAAAGSAQTTPSTPASPTTPGVGRGGPGSGAPGPGRGALAPVVIGPSAGATRISSGAAARLTCLLAPQRLNVAATFTQTAQRQGPRHEGFVEIARQGNIDPAEESPACRRQWTSRAHVDESVAQIAPTQQ